MPLVVIIAIAGLIAFTGIISMGVVSELYGTWPKFWTTGAFGAATAVFWLLSRKKQITGPRQTLLRGGYLIFLCRPDLASNTLMSGLRIL